MIRSFQILILLVSITINAQPATKDYLKEGNLPMEVLQYKHHIDTFCKESLSISKTVYDTSVVSFYFQYSRYQVKLTNDSLKILRTLLIDKYDSIKRMYNTYALNRVVYSGLIIDSILNVKWFNVLKDLDNGHDSTDSSSPPSKLEMGRSNGCSPYDLITQKNQKGMIINQMCLWINLKRLHVRDETLFDRLNIIFKNLNHWQDLDTWVKSLGNGKYRYGKCFGSLEFEVLKSKKVLWLKKEFSKVPVFSIF